MLMSAICVVFTFVLISTTAGVLSDCFIGATVTCMKPVELNQTDTNAACQAAKVYIGCVYKQGCQITAVQDQTTIEYVDGQLKKHNIQCSFSTADAVREAKMSNSVNTLCMSFWLLTLLEVLALVMKP